jgi:hypothetical protein
VTEKAKLNRLYLRKTTLRVLNDSELEGLAGGRAGPVGEDTTTWGDTMTGPIRRTTVSSVYVTIRTTTDRTASATDTRR